MVLSLRVSPEIRSAATATTTAPPTRIETAITTSDIATVGPTQSGVAPACTSARVIMRPSSSQKSRVALGATSHPVKTMASRVLRNPLDAA